MLSEPGNNGPITLAGDGEAVVSQPVHQNCTAGERLLDGSLG
jgi:hypothetical protein